VRDLFTFLSPVIDCDTILVCHALHHDLDVLRIIRHCVIDSAILSRNAVGVSAHQWGLKGLCYDLLHTELRKNMGEVQRLCGGCVGYVHPKQAGTTDLGEY
jgi:hypothetical protein